MSKKVLLVAGPDAHAVSMAVATKTHLEKLGAEVEVFCRFPQTHPRTFWGVRVRADESAPVDKLISRAQEGQFDQVVILDLPFDVRGPELSRQKLAKLAAVVPVVYIDHHATSDTVEEIPGVAFKLVRKAEACCLGKELPQIRRLGAICDRDESVLPVTPIERRMAAGLDVACRPDWHLEAGSEEALENGFARLQEAMRQLEAQNWPYFLAQSGNMPPAPVAAALGNVAVVETTYIPGSWVLKLMEKSMIELGCTYAIGIGREIPDTKSGRPDVVEDLVSVIRNWEAVTESHVVDVLAEVLGNEFPGWWGALDAQLKRIEPDAVKTATLAVEILITLAGTQLPDFSGVRRIGVGGAPHSGKSTFMKNLEEALALYGVSVFRARTDLAAPDPRWFLEAEEAYARGEIGEDELEAVRAKRVALKRPWTMGLADKAYRMVALATRGDYILADMPGKITDITSRIAEACDSAFIVARADQVLEMAAWRKFFKERGIRVLIEFTSVLEGEQQYMDACASMVTELDRAKARPTNPVISIIALLMARQTNGK